MASVRSLDEWHPEQLLDLLTGYDSDWKYDVRKADSEAGTTITLELVELPSTYHKLPAPIDDEVLQHYAMVPGLGFSFGAFDGGACVGIALAEPRRWNRSLWVWELHVAETHRRHGIGRALVHALETRSREAGLRTVVCETQTTNVPAIRFYRRLGFELDGVDLSYYSNRDFPSGEIAVFMKLKLE